MYEKFMIAKLIHVTCCKISPELKQTSFYLVIKRKARSNIASDYRENSIWLYDNSESITIVRKANNQTNNNNKKDNDNKSGFLQN